MPARAVFPAVLFAAAIAGGAASADDLTYHNARFGTRATFPAEAFTTRLPAPTSGDGLGWSSDNGAEIYIYARRNAGGETPDSIVRGREAQDEVTYRRSGRSWAVVSGYHDGKIFYERYILRGGLVHSVAIRYPEAVRKEYDPLVGPITMTLSVEATS